ncbi:MAG: phosphoribosylanthranilate isomerase [Calditrichaceae bacterium]|nr:phosphoribosylanthranilate isomerase [Calditrichaceae bacterium]HES59052.1 phosphoribosylanthranilate isomerase [Caldithrix sp.]
MYSRLKICGITNLDDALITLEIGAHWLGFNFYPESPRYVKPEAAATIIEEIKDLVHCVGILVRPTLEEVQDIIKQTDVDRIQIYQPQDFDDLSKFDVPAIICYQVNPDQPADYDFMGADMILLDSYSKLLAGGTGKSFNWSLIPDSIPREKLILAGGITTENIGEALRTVNPSVIDVASGSEKEPGVKDYKKIKELMNELYLYHHEQSKNEN